MTDLEINVFIQSTILDDIIESEHEKVIPVDITQRWSHTTSFGIAYFINYDSSIPKISVDLTFKRPIQIFANFEINLDNCALEKLCSRLLIGQIPWGFSYDKFNSSSQNDPILTTIYLGKINKLFNRLLITHNFYERYFRRHLEYLNSEEHNDDLMRRYERLLDKRI